jgi:acyl-ACP thioesterase|nr:acyl-[acyl-carrier-protein] thioesterase [Bacteroides sp.]
MNENIKIGSYPFIVEDFHADYTGKLSFSVLGNHLLNCSNLHARQFGFGMGHYNQEAYTWVISRLVIQLEEPLYKNEPFTLHTWVSKVYHYFINREYTLINSDNRLVGKAHAVWALIHEADRTPVNLNRFFDRIITDSVCDEIHALSTSKERFKLKETIPCFEHKVVYGDLDINGHVNSIKYIECILNSFSLDVYNHGGLYKLEIAYVEETSYGDRLLLYKEDMGCNSFYVEIRKDTDEIVCRCKLFFK